MRRFLQGVCLAGVAIGLIGCGASRAPHVVIAPAYSYVQADLAAGVTDQDVPTVEAQPVTTVASKLPPIPAAPGFDTYVMGPAEARGE